MSSHDDEPAEITKPYREWLGAELLQRLAQQVPACLDPCCHTCNVNRLVIAEIGRRLQQHDVIKNLEAECARPEANSGS